MSNNLHLFDAVGVELEYMIVDKDSLTVNPISDLILKEIAGEITSDVEFGTLEWSNELVLHVIELKTGKPASSLANLDSEFHKSVIEINKMLNKYNSILLPSGAHPLMDPFTDTKLWPHDNNEVYAAYNKIFDCRGHGWSNLQSAHINLPFGNDVEFGKLHAAIRLVLPLIPAIAASTPILDGMKTEFKDSRLEVYRKNQIKIPSIAGDVIPEQVFSIKDYNEIIFNRIYQDITPHDEKNILKFEWLNSRGAIARFVRNSIEIRIVDLQESPIADLAIIEFINNLIRLIISEELFSFDKQKSFSVNQLAKILLALIKEGEEAIISDKDYLELFGLASSNEISAKELLLHILQNVMVEKGFYSDVFKKILENGTLSTRILKGLDNDFSEKNIIALYKILGESLNKNQLFIP